MTNNLGRFILSSLQGGGVVRDYAHASNTFRPNSNANAGKYKFLFHVYFTINASISKKIDSRLLSYLVKRAELPKFNLELREMNQYNRKQLNQTRIKYSPITLTFHDDNASQIRELWRSYYNYYFSDGRYSENTYNFKDRYKSTRLAKSWGLDSGSSVDFFTSIDIYSLWAGKSMKVTLINPMINSFSHDTHDYADGASLMENTMQITYTSVKYENGHWTGTPGLGDFQFYDTQSSDIAGDYAGYNFDASSGTVYKPNEEFIDPRQQQLSDVQARSQQIFEGSNADRSPIASVTNFDTAQILYDQLRNSNNKFLFPTANFDYGVDYPGTVNASAVDVGRNVQALSESKVLLDSSQFLGVYEQGTWQRLLEEKGYDPRSISAAESAVDNAYSNNVIVNNSQAAVLAERYIEDRSKVENQATATLTQPDLNAVVSFQKNTVVEPAYNAAGWQQQLIAKGYRDYEIALVEENLTKIRLAPGVDIVSYAESYIRRNTQ
jgi:hypothetical protein